MTYAKFDVLKPGNNAGKGSDIKGTAILFEWADVLSGYSRDDDGITISGNLVFKPGAFMQKLEFTKSTLKNTSKSDGDDDKRGIIQGCEFQHPGSAIDIRKFRSYWLNRDAGIIYDHCDPATDPDLYGSPCNPMQMNFEAEESKDSVHTQFTFATVGKGNDVAIYKGTNTYSTVELVDADVTAVDLTAGEGQYQLTDNTIATEIVGFTNAVDKMVFTLLGSGGVNPASITAAGVMALQAGASWSGVAGATITFRVFKDGAATFKYIEQSRT